MKRIIYWEHWWKIAAIPLAILFHQNAFVYWGLLSIQFCALLFAVMLLVKLRKEHKQDTFNP